MHGSRLRHVWLSYPLLVCQRWRGVWMQRRGLGHSRLDGRGCRSDNGNPGLVA